MNWRNIYPIVAVIAAVIADKYSFTAGVVIALIVVVFVIRTIIKDQDVQNDHQDYEHTFELRWRADQRAIKRWQAATGKTLIWPDHADLCVWLMEELDALDDRAKKTVGK